jgi:hypothetical protein
VNAAKSARLFKERRPDRFCAQPGCLWMTKGGAKPCPRHPVKPVAAPVECVVCFEPITADQPSFAVPLGRCHEGRCRGEFNAMMVERSSFYEAEYEPRNEPTPHVPEWPAGKYKPWIR